MNKQIMCMLIMSLLLVGCNGESEKLTLELENKNLEITELENRVNELQKDSDKLKEALENNKKLEAKKQDLQNDIESLNEENELLKSQVAELESSIQVETHRYNSLVYSYDEGVIGMGINENDFDTYQNMKIIGYGDTQSWEHDLIDLSGDATASLSIEISGTLYNLRIEYIDWNDDISDYTVSSEVCHYDTITDTDILFDSTLAEGLPGELLTWEDSQGKKFYFLIHDTGLSGNINPYLIISSLADLEPWWENQE